MSGRLLWDYLRRTSSAWLLVGLIQIIQGVIFWAAGVRRAPLLAAVLAGLIYALSSEQPQHVLRTLPLTRTTRSLFRWLASFVFPAIAVLACMAVAVALNIYKGWPLPSPATLASCALAAITLLGWLTVFPARGYWIVAWGAAGLVGLIGLPTDAAGILPMVGLLGVAVSLATSLREPASTARGLARANRPSYFHGWGVLLVEVGRSTALLSAAALAASVILHSAIPQRLLPGGTLNWLFVSAVTAATGLPMRRWVEAVRSLRVLPLGNHRLALTLYFILMLPGGVTCLVLMAARTLSPNWGLDIPPHALVVFLIAPIMVVRWYKPYEGPPSVVLQQWVPALQQAAWPLWAGGLCSVPSDSWFVAYLASLALTFSAFGYAALLGGIRSTTALDGEPQVLLDA